MRRLANAVVVFAVMALFAVDRASADQIGYIFMSTPQNTYNYVPSVAYGTDGIEKIWWCSGTPGDTITYMALNPSTGLAVTAPVNVLHPGPGPTTGPAPTWDQYLTCDPSVIRGVWHNPIGNGVDYGYAMYYTGFGGSVSGVGVAFSNDGINWDKFPWPLIQNASSFPAGAYGMGEQTAMSADGQSGVWLFVVNSASGGSGVPPDIVQLYYAADGLNFTLQLPQLSTNGLIAANGGPGNFSEPMFSYNRVNGKLYFINDRTNDTPPAGDMDLYSIPWTEMTYGTWQRVTSLGSNSAYHPTGNPVNGDAGIMTDEFGYILFPENPYIQILFSTGQAYPPNTQPYNSLYWWLPTLPPQ